MSKISESVAVEVFKKFDLNGDGKISMKELEAVLNSMGSETSAEEVRRIMAELDVNGDGSIDLKEFEAFQAGSNDKEMKEAFDLYDKDKNGKISASELLPVLKGLGHKVSIKDCKKMIRSVDVDGDGSVNFQEFKNMMTRIKYILQYDQIRGLASVFDITQLGNMKVLFFNGLFSTKEIS